MTRRVLFALCFAGCTSDRAPPASGAPSATAASAALASSAPAAVADATSPPAPKLADCFEPSHLTQLGTIKRRVEWREELLSDGAKTFDPETLAEVSVTFHSTIPPADDFLATGERVEQHRTTLVAGARKLASLEPGAQLERVENGRWVVVAFGDGERTFEVIDGLSRKKDPHTYVAVSGDFAASQDKDTLTITVSNRVTGAVVLKDASPCASGGVVNYSLTSRFLWCHSSRFGSTGHDLRTGREIYVGQSAIVSPDESYFVRVPGVGLAGDLISEDRADWVRANDGRTVTLSTDVPNATDVTPALTSTVPIAFCGDGKLFAITTQKDLVVHRGADAKRLAAARAMPGGHVAFSKSGRYVVYERAGAATVYRLDP